MADFEDQLSGLFMAHDDPALGHRLGEAALAQIAREDGRRRLILVAGVAVGVLATLSIVDLSGAVLLARSLADSAVRIAIQPTYVWEAAAGVFAFYALGSLRRWRAA